MPWQVIYTLNTDMSGSSFGVAMSSKDPLTISYHHEPERLTVTLGGELDGTVPHQLVVASRYIAGLQPVDVTVDLAAVTRLTSTGLGFLAGLRNTVQTHGRVLTLASVPASIADAINTSTLGGVTGDATAAGPISHWFG